jgi:hypothetical protein
MKDSMERPVEKYVMTIYYDTVCDASDAKEDIMWTYYNTASKDLQPTEAGKLLFKTLDDTRKWIKKGIEEEKEAAIAGFEKAKERLKKICSEYTHEYKIAPIEFDERIVSTRDEKGMVTSWTDCEAYVSKIVGTRK